MDILPREDDCVPSLCVQDNALVRSAYTMTLIEKRLLMLAISKIDATTAPARGQPIQVRVTVDEWSSIYREKDPWSDLARAADRLMGRVVIMHPTEKKGVKKKLNWTDSCEYHANHVLIRFGYSLSIELAGMLDEITQADILDVAKLDSFYAVRLYELLRQFSATGMLVITVDELRVVMGAERKYPQFYQFNQRVIQSAIMSIKKRMPAMKLKAENLKTKGSRRVTSLKFTFKKSEQRDFFESSGTDSGDSGSGSIFDGIATDTAWD